MLRKDKQYKREIEICTNYIKQVEQHYATISKGSEADVRKGPKFKAIKERIKKAKILQTKTSR